MGVTRLKRKARRNKQRAADRVNKIKQLSAVPVIANVDKEELKASFETTTKAEKPKAKKAKKAEEVKEETPADETPKAEATETKADDAE